MCWLTDLRADLLQMSQAELEDLFLLVVLGKGQSAKTQTKSKLCRS